MILGKEVVMYSSDQPGKNIVEYDDIHLRYFDTVFGRPYRCFSITLKVILSLSDRYKIFTTDWLWIECEVCQNLVFCKISEKSISLWQQ